MMVRLELRSRIFRERRSGVAARAYVVHSCFPVFYWPIRKYEFVHLYFRKIANNIFRSIPFFASLGIRLFQNSNNGNIYSTSLSRRIVLTNYSAWSIHMHYCIDTFFFNLLKDILQVNVRCKS